MDATGLGAFSALPLFPLLALFWYLQKFSRTDVGFTLGRWRHYGLAVLYPLVVLGLAGMIAILMGAATLAEANWAAASRNLALIAAATVPGVILTEEGFFRGWLWASLQRGGHGKVSVLISTSLAFSLWHLSAATLDPGFRPPLAQVPVFLVNAAVIGAIWGMLRLISGSVIVSSISHAVWNGIDYALFGFGTHAGALHLSDSGMYGPENGVVGLALNLLFAAVLGWSYSRLSVAGEDNRCLPQQPTTDVQQEAPSATQMTRISQNT